MNLGEKNEESVIDDSPKTQQQTNYASGSPPPRRSKAQPLQSPMDTDSRRQTTTSRRPKGKLWTPDQDSLFTRSSFDPSNIASIQANKTRAQAMKPGAHRSIKSSPQLMPRSAPHLNHESKPQGEDYTIILQPETRPISQVQLVAEVKGIYADLVMVEAKCIEVDNKQAGLTQGDSSQPKLNNEQWQFYYYAKSLYTVVPFTSVHKSILTLFDPVLNVENSQSQYQLPPLDTAFIKAHTHLFTNRTMDRFDIAIKEFLGLLDILGFGSKENPIMKVIAPPPAADKTDIHLEGTEDESSPSMVAFRHAEGLNNSALDIVLH
ncbi:uncharacterized protein EAF01_003643 [Botrytis porri]|uniref:uncharacterized protein n=1 Tax=Botrytis porri TaxID=87229 RepID=UPI0018FF538A|nr:uncharacterized protein EAF01_003643 [Botrytis porri]KAF7909925.1 hypothetical protein EAF01_003643 [Botrytis porri]